MTIDAAVHTLRLDADPAGSVRRGERLTVRTRDASGVAVTLGAGMDRLLRPHLAASPSEEEKGSST